MSELSCVAASHPATGGWAPSENYFPGCRGKIAEDGDAWSAVAGVKRLSQRTGQDRGAIGSDGWLHGDVFDIDSDGYLRVVDRRRGPDHQCGGKNMSPASIENTILARAPWSG